MSESLLLLQSDYGEDDELSDGTRMIIVQFFHAQPNDLGEKSVVVLHCSLGMPYAEFYQQRRDNG